VSAARWITEGETLWDDSPALRSLAASVGDAEGAARWMAAALGARRGEPAAPVPPWCASAAACKYALAAAAGAGATAAAITLGTPWPLAAPLGVLAFYAVEVQFVFALPLAIDGERHPLRASRALLGRVGGTAAGLREVLPIAAHMLTGGLRGRGALRSWCAGCAAVIGWYEEARVRAGDGLSSHGQEPACATP
jgi:hypothetical protein